MALHGSRNNAGKKIMNYPLISIIVPTLNEEQNLPRLLASLNRLRYPKVRRELIIADGYSTDSTVAIAKKAGAKIVFNKARIRGAGCQIGVAAAKGEYVAFTDADCTVPSDWLGGLLCHFTDTNVASVGGPNVTPADDTLFAKAVGETLGLLTMPGARYGARSKSVGKTFHNPGCNVLYKRDAIQGVGGFNTRLVTCEDEELDYRLLIAGYTHIYTPRVTVDHFRRPTYKRIFVQSYRYAFGRVHAIRLHPGMARWFHFVPSVLGVLLLVSAVFAPLVIAGTLVSSIILALYMSATYHHVPWHTYLCILYSWSIGWAVGFIGGFVTRI